MSKSFLLHLSDAEHQSLKVAAAQAGASMNQFIRDAITERIARMSSERAAPAAPTLPARNAEHSASGEKR